MNSIAIAKSQDKTKKSYLFLVSFVAAMGGFLFGFDTAVISGTISYVTNDFGLNPVSEGWFVSCALLGCIRT
jgi:MFS transporter, SP family, arabinose:H+ symporter